ncbi:MAG: hypothetical protein K940chlam2_00029 [Chlamydiae bacterium]|nr:hypothetical protein [Chlamydiota bacterium]
MAKKIRVAITYICYPVAMARYFHEAMIQDPDIEVWSAGPFTGQQIPWGGGMKLPESYVLKPSHPTSMTAPPMVSYPMLEKAAPWQPDLWLEVNAGLTAIGKPTNAPLAMVLTDPHVLADFYVAQRSRADYIFNMQTPYMQQGDIWLPYGYSPIWHTETQIPFEERSFDASLIGLQYDISSVSNQGKGSRNTLAGRLINEQKQVFYRLGLAYQDARDVYHNTRVGLNWSSKQDTTARCFELMAFGLPAVMNRVPDLVDLFEDGKDFLGFDTEDEAVANINELLSNKERAVEMGKRARRSVEPHTWNARVKKILETAGLA